MTQDTELLERHLRKHQDRPFSVPDLASELHLPELKVAREIKDLVKRDGYFDLGNQRVMFTGDSDLAAYEIFRTAATHITYEEFIQYREQPHLLMRLSRDREVAYRSDPDKLLQMAVEEKKIKRGN